MIVHANLVMNVEAIDVCLLCVETNTVHKIKFAAMDTVLTLAV